MALLYGRAGRLTAQNRGFWPGRAVALLEPSLKALASAARPAAEGGRSFGILASVVALGSSLGSVGTPYPPLSRF